MNDDYEAEVICDSIAQSGARLTTMRVCYPRFVHSELMTHRQFSRNASSSRAIPVQRRIRMVRDTPVLPVEWGSNQRGMQAGDSLLALHEVAGKYWWLKARDACIKSADELDRLNVHKQLSNRLVETWSWITVLISSTEWSNYFGLRCDPLAQPELQKEAYLMRDSYLPEYMDEPSPEFIRTAHLMQVAWEKSRPKILSAGDWHLPFVKLEEASEFTVETLLKLSVARCARISYLNFSGDRDPEIDMKLHDGLRDNGHWSCFEHQAQEASHLSITPQSNFCSSFFQYRKAFPNECR